MNRNKRICTALLAMVLVLAAALPTGIGGVFAESAEKVSEYVTSLFAAEKTTIGSDDYIYFDLAAGNVNIGKTTYTGWVFVGGTPTKVTDAHSETNKYYIYQSNLSDKADTGYATTTDFSNKTNCRIPVYNRVKTTVDGVEKSWTEYITNNTKVKEISRAWDVAAKDSAGREGTNNYINFASDSNYTANVTIDNIWSTYRDTSIEGRTTGGIGADLQQNKNTKIKLLLKGDSRVGCVHYSSEEGNEYDNEIRFSDGEKEGTTPGSITVADFDGRWNGNHWCTAIGSNDYGNDRSNGIVIDGGVIYAGTTEEDNCTAIGGGGNAYGKVTINGGTVTAVTSGTGTAIGGGIGFSGGGGNADVLITGGNIFAYNLGVGYMPGSRDYFSNFVPAVAIGGGSSNGSDGNTNTNITITDGTVYAQSKGGPGIGGGGSASKSGGPANITITGGTVIAKSVGGTHNTQNVDPGVCIGGGTGLTAGGSVTLNIDEEDGKKTIIRAGSIGGGSATGKDESGNPYKVGNANVTVDGGDIIGQVIMAGGAANPCSFTMTGGVIHSTDVINGVTIGDENITGVTVTDPRADVPLSFKRQDGGAVFMNDPQGVAVITGGVIGNCTANNGGAVYMAGGTFTLSGTGQLGTNHAKENGGSVYVGGGTVQIGGGVTLKDGTVLVAEGSEDASKCAIRNSDAAVNGGGVYVVGNAGRDGAAVTMNGGEIHSNTAGQDGGGMYIRQGKVDIFGGSFHDNKATQDGGGVYVAGDVHMLGGSVTENKANNGGGFCVEDGKILMYGGSINGNSATENGGGMHIMATNIDATVDVFSGSVSRNKAKLGGGVSVVSDSNKPIYVAVGVNCEHTGLNTDTREFTEFPYPTVPADCGSAHDGHTHYHVGEEAKMHSSCPEVKGNIATENGGGFFLSSSQTHLDFYCVIEDGNMAHGNKQCYNMDVKGGHVIIGDETYDPTNADPVKGNIVMQSSIFVEGGTVDIYGKMDNPEFTDDVTVDIKHDTDHYIDHRITHEENLTFYKVHYYENFKGDSDTPTGLYIARQYPDSDHETITGDEKYDFTIMPSIFSHPGYKIVGWDKDPNGLGDDFSVNETYNLKALDNADEIGATNSGNEVDKSLLVIYAIWERSGYVLKFDPNVSEGETYSGTMENQRVTVGLLDGSQSISPNQFARHGYRFIGWTLTPAPSDADTVYADSHSITEDFTQEDGAIITLYAKWERCTHVDYLAYTADGNILTQSCSACGGHSATASVSAVNAVYDGVTHLATANFSVNWLGNKPEISYEMATSEWDSKDTADEDWQTNPQPIHAGSYTAKITAGDAAAKAEYVISPVKWETPAVPQISFAVVKVDATTYNSVITITTPIGDNLMYKITHLPNDGTETAVDGYPDWQSANEFSNIPYGKYYYFYAKVCADRDHLESDPSKSAAYLTTGGNIVYIENGDGIKVVPRYGTGEFKYIVSAADGYHLRGYNDNLPSNDIIIGPANVSNYDFVKKIPGVADSDAYILDNGIKISKTGLTDGAYTYTVTLGDVAYHQITLEFSGAVKNASVASKVTDGQVFSDFNSKETSISRDSAFTAQFTVSDYIPEEYTAQALRFSKALPAGTTVIMKVGGGYWYYNLGATPESVIDLTKFTEMGGAAKFTFDKADTAAKSFTYQFIVDFSKATGNTVTDPLEVSLELTADTAHGAPNVPTAGNSHITLDIQNEAVFNLTSAGVIGKSATLNCTYNPSAGAASIWNGRKTALVLTAPESAPADLTLTAVADGKTTLYKMNLTTDSGGQLIRQFIIPLGEVGAKEVKITLNSYMFASSESNLAFTAEWYVAQSNADKSPLNGYSAASCDVTFSGKKASVPSVRIDGTQRLCHAGEVLSVTVNYAGIPSGGKITAYLQSKSGGQYVDTGAKASVANDADSKQIEFNMGQMDKGSYRILVIVQESGANILQVPYYFVIA